MSAAAEAGRPFVDAAARRGPDLVSAAGSRTWSVRGRNAVVAVTDLRAGDRLVERGVPDEHVLLVQDQAGVIVEHADHVPTQVPGPSLVIVPAGTSVVHAAAATVVTRVFTTRGSEQAGRAVNHVSGVDPRATALPAVPETGGDGVRVHSLSDVPDEPGRLGRVFRTGSLMVNWFASHDGPRDTEVLSPHAHEDVEQLSVTLVGDYAHHLRVPWGPRMSEWRDDEHVEVSSPSITLIPPTVVHTTRAVGAGPHTLVDVFAPPREDFLARGWVLNAGDYPGPQP